MHNKYLRAKSFLMGKMIKKKSTPKLGRLSHMEKVKASDKVCFPDKNWWDLNKISWDDKKDWYLKRAGWTRKFHLPHS